MKLELLPYFILENIALYSGKVLILNKYTYEITCNPLCIAEILHNKYGLKKAIMKAIDVENKSRDFHNYTYRNSQ